MALWLAPAVAAHAAAPGFLRVAEAASGEGMALQVAIIRYHGKRKGRDVEVDLVSAVHVGDRSYYHDLNDRFGDYGVVLYELVADAETKPEAGDEPDGAISGLQVLMKDTLDLSYQLDEVDYHRDHFVHADFSPDELSDDMDARGESIYTYFWRLFFAASADSARDPFGVKQARRLREAAVSDADDPFKIALAHEFVRQTRNDDFLSGSQGSAIIEGRNLRALEVLEREMEKGETSIAIFYGAGHMVDFDRRLIKDFGMRRGATTWVDAWHLD